MSQAKADIVAAHALRQGTDPGQPGQPGQLGLRGLGAAFAAGRVSREHVDAAVRLVQQLPAALLSSAMLAEDGTFLLDQNGKAVCAGDAIDQRITAHAQEYDSRALAILATQLKETLDPDGSFNPEACLRRSLRLHWDYAGMLVLRGELDPAAGALLESLIDQLSSPKYGQEQNQEQNQAQTGDGTLISVKDQRSTVQRQADALMELVTAGQASGRAGTRGGEPPRIMIITRAEDLAAARAVSQAHRAAAPDPGDGGSLGTGTRISPGLLELLSCDAVLQKALLAPNGAILNLGREARTLTPAQRRALMARDRGCVIPGCTAPPPWCHGHHVQWWSNGGESDIGNLVLVCPRHHTEVHAGTWSLTMTDGVPWAVPPDWIDPEQRPQRNHYPDQLQDMRDLGTQLRLNLDGRPAPDNDPDPPDAPDP